jgi:hypothetical protein
MSASIYICRTKALCAISRLLIQRTQTIIGVTSTGPLQFVDNFMNRCRNKYQRNARGNERHYVRHRLTTSGMPARPSPWANPEARCCARTHSGCTDCADPTRLCDPVGHALRPRYRRRHASPRDRASADHVLSAGDARAVPGAITIAASAARPGRLSPFGIDVDAGRFRQRHLSRQ